MRNSKQKLELTWIGKEKRPKLEPRFLLEAPEKSYHAKHRLSEADIFDNRLAGFKSAFIDARIRHLRRHDHAG